MPSARPGGMPPVLKPFATIKTWMGKAHFLCKGLKAVRTEMSLHVLAYNLRRVMAAFGARWLRHALAT
jgi:hypothetical protein